MRVSAERVEKKQTAVSSGNRTRRLREVKEEPVKD